MRFQRTPSHCASRITAITPAFQAGDVGSTPIWRLKSEARRKASLTFYIRARWESNGCKRRAIARKSGHGWPRKRAPRPVAKPTGCRRAEGRLPFDASIRARLFGGSLYFKATGVEWESNRRTVPSWRGLGAWMRREVLRRPGSVRQDVERWRATPIWRFTHKSSPRWISASKVIRESWNPTGVARDSQRHGGAVVRTITLHEAKSATAAA